MLIVLMGVTGSGKTTIGTLLAQREGVPFADADDFHSAANKAKMAAGTPLTDKDREPWLETLNGLLRGWVEAGKGGVLACSALKDKYRTTLSAGIPDGTLRFVLLEGSHELITDRLAHRQHTFMNPALLDSQLATLERPEGGLAVCNDRPPDEVVDGICRELAARGK